jgi:hypothetical protein
VNWSSPETRQPDEDLAHTLDADALTIAGDPGHATVEEFAARLRLLVLRLPSGNDPSPGTRARALPEPGMTAPPGDTHGALAPAGGPPGRVRPRTPPHPEPRPPRWGTRSDRTPDSAEPGRHVAWFNLDVTDTPSVPTVAETDPTVLRRVLAALRAR